MKQYISYILVKSFWLLCGVISVSKASKLGYCLGYNLYRWYPKAYTIRRNLKKAFPEKTTEERKLLGRHIFANFCRVGAEFVKLDEIINRNGNIEVVQQCNLEPIIKGEKQAIFVTAHIANWELSAAVAAKFGVSLSIIYTPLENKYIAEKVYQIRQKSLQANLVAKNGGMRELVRQLQLGNNLGILMDQRFDGGELVPFFSLPAPTALGPARLALKFSADLIPVKIERTGLAKFKITLLNPVVVDNTIEDEYTKAYLMTEQINRLFAEWIKENPDQWWCGKRRWPKKLFSKK